LLESYRATDGKTVKRITTSAYIWAAFACLGLGIYLVYNQILFGAFLTITAFPFLLLYPLVRALFGGKDSIGAAIVTAVVEETLKNQVKKAASGKKNGR